VAIHRRATNPSLNILLRQAKKMIVPEHITHVCHQAVASLYLQFHNTTLNTPRRRMAIPRIHAHTNKTPIDPTRDHIEMTEATSKIMAEVVRNRWLSPSPRRDNEPQLLADIAEEER
jgi:hypothetical protein